MSKMVMIKAKQDIKKGTKLVTFYSKTNVEFWLNEELVEAEQ